LIQPNHNHQEDQKNSRIVNLPLDGEQENEVWKKFLDGDDSALSWIYRSYIEKLYNYGCQFAPHEVVLDTIQDLFFDLIRSRKKLSTTNSVKAYLYSSLRRKLLTGKGKRNKEVAINQLEEQKKFAISVYPDQNSPLGTEDDEIQLLQKACNELPDRQREIILLYYFEEMSYQDIMEVMQINKINSARILVHRALESLRKLLAGMRSSFLLLLLLFFSN